MFNCHTLTLVNTELLFELDDAAATTTTTRLRDTATPALAAIKITLLLDVLETVPTAPLLPSV